MPAAEVTSVNVGRAEAAVGAARLARGGRATRCTAQMWQPGQARRRISIAAWVGEAVLVNRLPLVVVVRMQLPIWPGDRLRCFVSLEALVQRSLMSRARVIAEALIAQHQVVMRLQILRVDAQHLVELLDRFGELAFQEEDPAELIEHDAIAWIKIRRRTQVPQRLVVAPVVFQRDAEEEMGLR